jgi:small-conductance mechanosensitive channel
MSQQAWFSAFREVSQKVGALIPALLGSVVLILAGWLLGRLLAWIARRLVTGLMTRLARRPLLGQAIESSGAAAQVPAVISAFVFWVVLVFFVAAAMETLGLPVVTASLSRVAYYLPNVLAALVVVFVGLIAGKLTGSAVTRTAASTGMAFAPTLGGTVRGTIVLLAVVIAIEQIGIKADLLIVIVAVVLGSILAGAGLAFGLGARTVVSNIIAAHYVSQAYRIGQTVRINGVEGKIVQTTPTAVFITNAEGRVMIPAKQFSEGASVLVTEAQA